MNKTCLTFHYGAMRMDNTHFNCIMDRRKKIKSKNLLIYGMLNSHRSVLYHQKLIDEWDDPKGIVTQATVIIRDIHGFYGTVLYEIYEGLKENE